MRLRWLSVIALSVVGGWPRSAEAFGGSGARIWLPEAASTSAPIVDQLFYAVLAMTGVVFVLVQGTLLYFVIRYRHRPDRRAAYTHGNTMAEIVWTVIPALILIGLAVYNQRAWARVRGTPPPSETEVEIQGEQFAWNIRYPGADRQLHTADDLITINQLHLPVRQTVLLHVTAKDVIHSFFVPAFRVKQDATPGLTARMWIEPTKTGDYEIACAELCGLGHYRMRGFLTIEEPDAFHTWLSQLQAEQHPPAEPEPTT